MSHFKDKIEDTQKKLDQARSDVAELMGMAEAEARDLSDEESLQLEAYAADIEASEKRIGDLERAEKAMAERVVEKQAPAIAQAKHLGSKERTPGEILFKHATTQFLAHCNKQPLEVAAQTAYPTDHGLQAVVKAAVNPAATDVAGWASELTEETNQGFLDLLRGDYVTPQLWSVAGLNLNFEGYTAINIPSRLSTQTGQELGGGWTGERDAIPVSRMTTATQKITPYKWGIISSFSKELSMRSVPSIQALITSQIAADTGTKLDNDYLGEAAAVAGFNPAGLMNGVTGTPAATGGATVGDDMLADLKALINPFYAANLEGGIRIMMHPSNALAMSLVLYNGTYLFKDELARGTLMGIPVIQSTNVPIDELQAVVMSAQAVANGGMSFDVSDTATFVEIDDQGANTTTNPAMEQAYPRTDQSGQVGDAATWNSDALNTTKAPIRSLWQTESVAIKMVQYLSWATLRTDSVNRITGISY
jgi:hypothetical protein